MGSRRSWYPVTGRRATSHQQDEYQQCADVESLRYPGHAHVESSLVEKFQKKAPHEHHEALFCGALTKQLLDDFDLLHHYSFAAVAAVDERHFFAVAGRNQH